MIILTTVDITLRKMKIHKIFEANLINN